MTKLSEWIKEYAADETGDKAKLMMVWASMASDPERTVERMNIEPGGMTTDEQQQTVTTIWRGGYVTDNFHSYYVDENMAP